MIKKIAKIFLSSPPIKRRLTAFYCSPKGLNADEINASLADRQVWYMSQVKTGTTFLCNALAFYNAAIHSITDVDFGNIEDGGVGRSPGKNKEVLQGLLRYQRSTGGRLLIHTHHSLLDCRPTVFLCSTRDPFDYAVSSYYFFYKNRHNKTSASVDTALPQIINRFCITHSAQREAAKRCKNVVKVEYNKLVQDKEKVLCAVIDAIYGRCDEAAMRVAIERAAVDKLKQFEAEQGYAQIAAKGSFNKPHFVRSGKIGEGKEFFTRAQIQLIEEKLKAAGIPNNGKFDF